MHHLQQPRTASVTHHKAACWLSAKGWPKDPHQIRCFRLKQPITNDVHKTSLEVSLNVLQAYLAQLQAQPSSNPRATTEEAHIARQVSGLQWLTLGWVRICASQSTPPRVVRPCTANVTGVIQEEVVMF